MQVKFRFLIHTLFVMLLFCCSCDKLDPLLPPPEDPVDVKAEELIDLAMRERWSIFPKYLNAYQGEVDITDVYGYTLLIRAAYQENSEIVRELIKRGADVNARNRMGTSPLHAAAYSDHLKNVEILLELGAEVDIRDCEKQTPLFTAVRCSSPNLVELLLEHGAMPNIVDKDGNTPLLYAIIPEKKPHLKTIELLLEFGADPNYANPKTGYIDKPEGRITLIPGGETALILAEAAGYEDIAELLKRYGAQRRNTGLEILEDITD